MNGWLVRAVAVTVLVGPAVSLAPGTSLDAWIVGRYRGAQLLPDSTVDTPSLARRGSRPRIESVRSGRRADTLMAVHFATESHAAMLAIGARARLAGPTGTITPVLAQVLGRRPFRTPRAPGTPSMPDSNWRHGWAYLVLVPHVEGRPPARYRGWTLLEAPEPAPRRRAGALR